MSKFIEIKATELKENIFDMIGTQWMLVTAGNREKVNTMTASWGGAGIMWGKPVVWIGIRHSRYTKEFVDREAGFSLTVFGEEYKKMLSYMGTVSGRDEDKIEKQGLTLLFDGEVPYFEEAKIVLKVKKLYKQDLCMDCFEEKDLVDKWYGDGNLHTMYVCEIEKVLVAE